MRKGYSIQDRELIQLPAHKKCKKMGEKKFPLIDQDQKCMKNTDKQGKCPFFTNVECQVA